MIEMIWCSFGYKSASEKSDKGNSFYSPSDKNGVVPCSVVTKIIEKLKTFREFF